MIAEKIGNRSVNAEEHKKWEDRLVRLGILERRIDNENELKENFRKSVKCDIHNSDPDIDKPEAKQPVLLEAALQKNAEQMYINTGMVPIGYKKNEKGKIERIQSEISFQIKKINKLSASRDNLSLDEKNKKQEKQLSH